MSTTAETMAFKKDSVYYVHVAIVMFFMFGFGKLPPVGPLTPIGMEGLGIFISLLWAWTFVDLLWPSLLSILAVGLTGYMPLKQAFFVAFGDDTVLMILFVFVFAAYMNMVGINRAIAYYFISRKIAIGKPYVIYLMFFYPLI